MTGFGHFGVTVPEEGAAGAKGESSPDDGVGCTTCRLPRAAEVPAVPCPEWAL